jgi:hypothetical protein
MQPVLKGLHSPDVADLKTYVPDEEETFGFFLEAEIGTTDGEGADIFGIMVCTPRWLIEKYRPSDMMLGLHKIIVFKYDYLQLRNFIEKYLRHCSGDTWEEIARKVSLLGQWEFENMRPNPR